MSSKSLRLVSSAPSAASEGPTRIASTDIQEILRLLSEIPAIGKSAPIYAPLVSAYIKGQMVNVADMESKDENPTIMFTVLKGSVQVGRHNEEGDFQQFALLQPLHRDVGDTIIFSPEVKIKKLTLRANEDGTLVLLIKKDRFVPMLENAKVASGFRKAQEKMFHRIAVEQKFAKAYRYNVFLLRHLARLFIRHVMNATVSQNKRNLDFLTRKIINLLEEFATFKSLNEGQQDKILKHLDQLEQEPNEWMRDTLTKDVLNPSELASIQSQLVISSFSLHQNLLDLLFEKDK